MTKQEFENSKEPLVLIVSVDINTGKCIYDTYDWRTADAWVEDFEKDFRKMIHFQTYNKSAIIERQKAYGLVEA
jgi:hypothetical protein